MPTLYTLAGQVANQSGFLVSPAPRRSINVAEWTLYQAAQSVQLGITHRRLRRRFSCRSGSRGSFRPSPQENGRRFRFVPRPL